MLILGGSGPGIFLKLGVRRLNLEAFLVVLAVNQILVLFNTCLTVVLGSIRYFDRD